MLSSLLLRLGMLMFTVGMVYWIGWSVPESRFPPLDESAQSAKTPDSSRETAGPVTAARIAEPSLPPSRAAQPPRHRTLDLNQATEQDLESLPGVGPVLAARIVGYRQEVGSFRRVEDLRAVKGIGKKTFERIKTLVSVQSSPDSTLERKKRI
jgi:competence protein ComEA